MTKSVPVLVWLLMLVAAGCTTTRMVTIRTDPPDAQIRVEGVVAGRGKVTQPFTFDTPNKSYKVNASREGYHEKFDSVGANDDRTEILLTLRPETRRVDILIDPVPAFVSIDGKEISDTPVPVISHELEMGVDPKTNNPIVHEITATQKNFQPATLKVSRADNTLVYNLRLKPLSKPITVVTDPPGAQIFLDDTLLGVSPLKDVPVDFPADYRTFQIHDRTLKVRKPGYDEKQMTINWDNGKSDYPFSFAVKSKQVRIRTEPNGAKVFINGNELPIGGDERATAKLDFPPINDNGDLKTYTATISKKAEDSEWETQTLQIGWDNERHDYSVTLNEIRTRQVQLLVPNVTRADGGWEVSPEWVNTLAMRDTKEPADKPAPQRIHALARGYQLGPLTISPDGSQLLFTTITASENRQTFRSQISVVPADGKQEAQMITRGDALDLMPSFSPGGDQIVFASNRGGRKLNVWRISAKVDGVLTRLTSGDSTDLWPAIDSDPRPRLFYQTMIDTRPDPRIYMVQLGTQFSTDLVSGSQPRVAPTNDSILYWVKNDSNNNRDIYRISDKGGPPDNLSNTPEADEYDASWSRDARRVVFASNRGADETARHNYDIWMVDLTKPGEAIQLTSNGSHDDSPVFDLSGANVYFRSNRGGEWGIWKIAVPK